MARPNARCRPCSSFTVTDNLEWAAIIGGKAARRYRLRVHEREDVVSAAQLALCELLDKSPAGGGFDPSRTPTGGNVNPDPL